MIEQLEDQFTRYEIARILGARALQIAMDAPLLLKISEKELEEINYNPIEIAKRELISEVLPITVNRPLPKRKEGKLKKLSKEEIERLKEETKKKEAPEAEVEVKETEETEMMELSNPEDETEETSEEIEETGI